jgi:hypothetical protein
MKTAAPRIVWFIASLAALAATVGCASGTQYTGRSIAAERVGEIAVGSSNKADVLEIFGPPTYYSRLPPVPLFGPAGEVLWWSGAADEDPPDVFVYEFREDHESFFTVILFTRFRRVVSSDVLVVFFDDDDVVEYVSFAGETGTGGP